MEEFSRPTGGWTRSPTAKKPSECYRGCGNDDSHLRETSRRQDPEEHPSSISAFPQSLQGLRERGCGPWDLRTEDKVRSRRAQGRVLLLQVGVYGRKRRGRPPHGLDALPEDGKQAGYLSRRRPRARPCPPVRRGEAAVPGRISIPRCAHGNRGVQSLHRGRTAARDDGSGVVQIPEGRVDGRRRREEARPKRRGEGSGETHPQEIQEPLGVGEIRSPVTDPPPPPAPRRVGTNNPARPHTQTRAGTDARTPLIRSTP